jgi:hypothetical protein
MSKLLCCFLFFCFLSVLIKAQAFPKEGATLNFRIIGFSDPVLKQATGYNIEIARGRYYSEDSFIRNKILTIPGKANRIIAEVPGFGAQYTWRISYAQKKYVIKSVGFHHFQTGTIPEIDSANFRFRVLQHAAKYKDAYVFLDINKALYNMKGEPVWYLPKTGNMLVRDLKTTHQNTITYVIDDKGAYEINYNGDSLWAGPNNIIENNDSIEHYHHEFTRLNNGHYMALAQNFKYWKSPAPGDSSLNIASAVEIKKADNNLYSRTPMVSLIEYDRKGKVVWSWRASDHLIGSKLFYRTNATGAIQMTGHENSFYFDENSKVIYVSARNLNRILKIKYPEGNLLSVYGNCSSLPGSKSMAPDALFCGQHSVRVSKTKNLYLYDNNTCNPGQPPYVVVFKEPGGNALKKIWEFACPVDSIGAKGFPSGGNVLELPGGELFVSDAFPDSKVFIVNMNKEILWSAVAEAWNATTKKWEPVNIFRASIIPDSRKLEQLIWASEK